MDLIPVFSLIVLVATIGTFILAVGAYVMFRLREMRPRAQRPQIPASFEAEVIAPELIGAPQPAAPLPGASRQEHNGEQKPILLHPESHHPGTRPGSEDRRRWG